MGDFTPVNMDRYKDRHLSLKELILKEDSSEIEMFKMQEFTEE